MLHPMTDALPASLPNRLYPPRAPPYSCAAAWPLRSAPASGSCRTRCPVTLRAACPPTARCTPCVPPPPRCSSRCWRMRRRCRCCLETVRLARDGGWERALRGTRHGAAKYWGMGWVECRHGPSCRGIPHAHPHALCVPAGAGSAASRGSLAEEARLLDRLSAAVSRIFDDLLAGASCGSPCFWPAVFGLLE